MRDIYLMFQDFMLKKPFFRNQEIIEKLFSFSFFMATTWSFFFLFFSFSIFFLPPQKSLFIFKTGQGQLSIPTLE